ALDLPALPLVGRPRRQLRAQDTSPEAACAFGIVGGELDQRCRHNVSMAGRANLKTQAARRSRGGRVATVCGGPVRRSSSPLAAFVCALVLLGLLAVPSQAPANPAAFLHAAKHGVARTSAWWEKKRHWYRSTLSGKDVASLWGVVPLFEAVNGIAAARPSPRNLGAVNFMAYGALRYLNPNLQPVPGFGPKPGQREPGKTTWFD